MEELLVGNSVFILFWVYITFMVTVKEKFKVVVLMYLITYVTNILNIVPTIESYLILVAVLFVEFEFFEDNFKRQIITNWFEKILDFAYISISEYAIIWFTLALFCSSGYILEIVPKGTRFIAYLISFVFVCFSCEGTANRKYIIKSFGEIKKKIDEIMSYREFLENEKEIVDPLCVLCVEDANFYERGEKYSFVNTFYLRRRYLHRACRYVFNLFIKKDRIHNVKRVLRGYSTIEMQLLRTIGIKYGYDCIIRRKIFEILYARLFLKNLRKYYKRCECPVERYKDYILYLYLRSAQCLNHGQEQKLEKIIKSRKEILEYTREELFVLALCFSGKVKRGNVIKIYEEKIDMLNLDKQKLKKIIIGLNS